MTKDELNAVNSDMVTLREYIESLLAGERTYFDSRLSSVAEATRVKAEVLESRFESVNEFRASLSDQAAHFMTRVEFDAKLDRLRADIDALKEFKAQLQGKASQSSVNLATAFSLFAAFMGAVSLILNLSK